MAVSTFRKIALPIGLGMGALGAILLLQRSASATSSTSPVPTPRPAPRPTTPGLPPAPAPTPSSDDDYVPPYNEEQRALTAGLYTPRYAYPSRALTIQELSRMAASQWPPVVIAGFQRRGYR